MSQYPDGIEWILETWIPRMSRAEGINHVCFYSLQGALAEITQNFQDYFFSRPVEDVVAEYEETITDIFKKTNPEWAANHGSEHVRALHALGYLPIKVKALAEGTFVPIGVAMFTIENTDPRFFWIPGYIETQLSSYIWSPMTSGTISSVYKKILIQFARETGVDEVRVDNQAGDFSMRGMNQPEAAYRTGPGHLLAFNVSATVPVRNYLKAFYQKPKGAISCNPSTEHSVMCSWGIDEVRGFLTLITKKYPSGNISIVSDTYDFWNVISTVLPEIKPQILSRPGKVFIRPDSGDPVEVVCGRETKIFLTMAEAKKYYHNNGFAEMRLGVIFRLKDGSWWKVTREDDHSISAYHPWKDIYEEYTPTVEDLGLCEALWNEFGGTVNANGFKEHDSHIGITYGDAITIERCFKICKRLRDKGFASINVSFGIGSFTYQYVTRDTFGFALKGIAEIMSGVFKKIQKLVKSEKNSFKKSPTGIPVVIWDESKNNYAMIDNLTPEEADAYGDKNLLKEFYKDGEFYYLNSWDEIKVLYNKEMKRVYNL